MEQPFDPSEVEVERDPTSGDFIANFADNNQDYLRSGLFGRTARLDGLLIATAVLPRECRNGLHQTMSTSRCPTSFCRTRDIHVDLSCAILRHDIQNGHPVSPFIGIYDAFSATIAAKHSPNLFYSGFGFAASHYGLPDLGYIAWSDIVQAASRIRQILPDIKLLVDIDDCYADTAVACHVTRQLEAMRVAMIMLEDQARPRRCGHHYGKSFYRLSNI